MKQTNPCKIRLWERKGENRICLVCKKEFYAPRSFIKKGGGKYCSRDCYAKGKINGEYRKCPVCNVEFYTTPCMIRRGWGKYCSKQCRLPMSEETREKIAKGHRGEKSYLWLGGRKGINKTRIDNYKWRLLRKTIYERDNWKCQICGKQCSRGDIACHHVIPWRIENKDEPKNLITLCNSCHTVTDNNIRYSHI